MLDCASGLAGSAIQICVTLRWAGTFHISYSAAVALSETRRPAEHTAIFSHADTWSRFHFVRTRGEALLSPLACVEAFDKKGHGFLRLIPWWSSVGSERDS